MTRHHLLTALLLCTIALSCKQEQIEPIEKPSEETAAPSLTIDRHTLKIAEGQIEKLNASLANTEEGLSISWKSTVPSVANVNGKGEVEGLKRGTAQVIAYAGYLADTCDVEVGPKPIPAKSIKLSSNGFVTKTGEQIQLTATFSPLSTTDTLRFSSSDENIVTVSQDGLVSAIGAGKCTITASIGSLSDECEVSVISGSEASLMLADPLDKVYEGATFLPGEDIFRVAGGEVATIQIVINAGDKPLNNIDIAFNALAGTLEPEVYVEREILCTGNWQSYAYGRPEDELVAVADMYPDPLIPIDEIPDFDIEAHSRKVLWIEYWVPKGFKDGEYKISLKLSATEDGKPVELTQDFTVKVYPVSLPEKQHLMICNWTHGNFDAMNGGQPCDIDREFELRKVIIPFMERYGQNVWHSDRMSSLLPVSWPYLKMNEVGSKDYIFDFSVLDREIEFYLETCTELREFHAPDFTHHNPADGGNYKIVVYTYDETDEAEGGVWQDGIYKPNGTRWPSGGGRYYSDPLTDRYLRSHFKQRAEYLKSKPLPGGGTWLDIYRQQIAEEGNDGWAESWNDYARTIKEVAPELKLLEPIGSSKIDYSLLDEPVISLGMFEKIPPKDHNQWMYSGIIPQGKYANRFIRMPLIKTRIMHWINYRYNHVGYLHWGMKYWMDGNGNNVDPFTADAVNGDSWIVYPGYEKIYPSIRLCAMRDGIRDFDLLKLVEAKDKEKAQEFVLEMVQDYSTYNTEVEHFRDLRKRMLEYLSK